MNPGTDDQLAVSMGGRARGTALHGVLVAVFGVGVLITGESGRGKSECALGLISRGHALIADDVVLIDLVDDRPVGRPPARFAGLIAIRGLGIFDVGKVFGDNAVKPFHQIDLVIEFYTSDTGVPRDGQSVADETSIATLPKIKFDVSMPRDLPLLTETAVKIYKGPGFFAQSEILSGHDDLIGRIDRGQ